MHGIGMFLAKLITKRLDKTKSVPPPVSSARRHPKDSVDVPLTLPKFTNEKLHKMKKPIDGHDDGHLLEKIPDAQKIQEIQEILLGNDQTFNEQLLTKEVEELSEADKSTLYNKLKTIFKSELSDFDEDNEHDI
jgi:hypothetical protein